MTVETRETRPEDLPAAIRIWREVGWIESDAHEQGLKHYLEAARGRVALAGGEAESLVLTTPGTLHYQDQPLDLSLVLGVTTSLVARQRGWAPQLLGECLAEHPGQVAALGTFEQGYYDKFGFGSSAYDHFVTFDPAGLQIDAPFRLPVRLAGADWREMHTALMNRRTGHGSIDLCEALVLQAELAFRKGKDRGFGYRDGPGDTLSHFVYGVVDGEHGTYRISHYAWQTPEQLRELLALIRSFGDQYSAVHMPEPRGVQLQTLIKQPFRTRRLTHGARQEFGCSALAWWQFRITDLPGCLARTHLEVPPLRFNLELDDPIVPYLADNAEWRGCAGGYVVSLGPESSARPGREDGLALLRAGVGAFSRLWFGIAPATGLAVSDQLEGPAELLEQLDQTLRLPPARNEWDF